ncbi:MAG: YgfZ/GcvT domain-containing protein [Ignavibacterium sp.]
MFDSTMINNELLTYFESKGYNVDRNNGAAVIKSFSKPEDEIFSLYNGVGLRHLHNASIIELRGIDSADFLHRITTNSLKEFTKEQIRQTIFTTEKGRIIDVVTVLNFESHLILVGNLSNKVKVMSWINRYVISDDVKQSDANHRFNILEFSGPQADSFMTWVCGSSVSEIPVDSFKVMNVEGILFFLAKMKDERGFKKYWALTDTPHTIRLLNYVIANTGPFDFNLIGDEAYNSFRIEQGIPAAPNEICDLFNPHELNLSHLIDTKKGCYIGQEVLARLETYDKVQKKLTGLTLESPVELNNETELIDSENQNAGIITSLVNSVKLKKPIALAVVRRSYLNEQSSLFVVSGNSKTEAKVTSLPFKK